MQSPSRIAKRNLRAQINPPVVTRDLPDWEQARLQYEETKDIEFAAYVIGKWPRNPPQWAIDACKRLYKEKQRRPGPFVRSPRKGRRATDKDGEWLDEVADILIGARNSRRQKEISVRAAILEVLGPDRNDANLRRLQKYWTQECQARDTGEGPEPHHPRIERALVRWAKATGRFVGWDPAANN